MDARKRDKWGRRGLNGGGARRGTNPVVRRYLLSCHCHSGSNALPRCSRGEQCIFVGELQWETVIPDIKYCLWVLFTENHCLLICIIESDLFI
jgi:hypothetical protein